MDVEMTIGDEINAIPFPVDEVLRKPPFTDKTFDRPDSGVKEPQQIVSYYVYNYVIWLFLGCIK